MLKGEPQLNKDSNTSVIPALNGMQQQLQQQSALSKGLVLVIVLCLVPYLYW